MEKGNQELVPVEQQTLIFYGKPIVVVRLADGRPGVVLRFLCENLQLQTNGQIARIQRTAAIAEDLVYVRVDTEGGTQRMAALILHSVPYWLLGIDPKRARPEMREEILRYQKEAVDVLYAWAQTPRAIAAPANLVPSEPITEPDRPSPDASLAEWHEYHLRMAAVLEWQMEVENWRGSVETRLQGLEAMTGLIPGILERLGPEKLTLQHQNLVKDYYVPQLSKATGKPHQTIYGSIYMAFGVPRYTEIPEAEWDKLLNWFKREMERAGKKLKEAPEQENLF